MSRRPVLHRGRDSTGPLVRHHHQSDRRVGYSAGPQPRHDTGRGGAGRGSPDPRSRRQVHPVLRRRLGFDRCPGRAHPGPNSERDAFAERWVGTARRECRDHLLIVGRVAIHQRGVHEPARGLEAHRLLRVGRRLPKSGRRAGLGVTKSLVTNPNGPAERFRQTYSQPGSLIYRNPVPIRAGQLQARMSTSTVCTNLTEVLAGTRPVALGDAQPDDVAHGLLTNALALGVRKGSRQRTASAFALVRRYFELQASISRTASSGLKPLWPSRAVWVRIPPRARNCAVLGLRFRAVADGSAATGRHARAHRPSGQHVELRRRPGGRKVVLEEHGFEVVNRPSGLRTFDRMGRNVGYRVRTPARTDAAPSPTGRDSATSRTGRNCHKRLRRPGTR